MQNHWTYTVDTSRVVAETVDGEVLAIDNDTGTYFNIEGQGVDLWEALTAGASREDVIGSLVARYGHDEAAVARDVDELVGTLFKLGVLVECADSAPLDTDPVEVAYQEPVLSVFTDLQDLLLFDPIHEVAEAGWPHKPE